MVGLPFKCHRGRWSRSVVAGVLNDVALQFERSPISIAISTSVMLLLECGHRGNSLSMWSPRDCTTFYRRSSPTFPRSDLMSRQFCVPSAVVSCSIVFLVTCCMPHTSAQKKMLRRVARLFDDIATDHETLDERDEPAHPPRNTRK